MTRAKRTGLAIGLVLALIASPALGAKPDKGDKGGDKPGYGPPIHAPAHGVRRATGECKWAGCPNPTPPEPDPKPEPQPPIVGPGGLPPVDDLPDTAMH